MYTVLASGLQSYRQVLPVLMVAAPTGWTGFSCRQSRLSVWLCVHAGMRSTVWSVCAKQMSCSMPTSSPLKHLR